MASDIIFFVLMVIVIINYMIGDIHPMIGRYERKRTKKTR
jgi:hypothetical protein